MYFKKIILIFLLLGFSLLASSSSSSISIKKEISPQLRLIKHWPDALITTRTKGAENIRWGFEGGRVVKIKNTYHLFTSEMIDDPIWTKMKLGYWTSKDGLTFKRISTIKQGSGDFTGKDNRAALWSPMVVFDSLSNHWNLFYVAYKSAPSLLTNFLGNHHGQIWRSVSKIAGISGIGGPYQDIKVVLKPESDGGSWEGLQGTDSFFPYKVGNNWYALHGSAQTEFKPVKSFLVGLAKSSSKFLAGPWKRLAALSPTALEDHFIENPIVTPLAGGGYVCVYDCEGQDAIGWAYSKDGIHWSKGNRLVIQPNFNGWAKDIRTPLGLVYESNNKFTLYYTGFEQTPDWNRLLTGQGKETCAIGRADIELNW